MSTEMINTLAGLLVLSVLAVFGIHFKMRNEFITNYLKEYQEVAHSFLPQMKGIPRLTLGLIFGGMVFAYFQGLRHFSLGYLIAFTDVGIFIYTLLFMMNLIFTSRHILISNTHIEFSTYLLKEVRRINWSDIDSIVFATKSGAFYIRQTSDPEFEKTIYTGNYADKDLAEIAGLVKKHAAKGGISVGLQVTRRVDVDTESYL